MSFWGIGLLFIACQASAYFSPGVPFYRSPQSSFPSGTTRLDDLEKNRQSEQTQNFYQVTKDGRSFRLQADQVLRDLDLSYQASELATGETGRILQARSPWYEWQSPTGEKSWKSAEQLLPVPEDLGIAFVSSDHAFRQTPDATSEPLFDVHVGARFRVLGFQKDFVHVESLTDENARGFLQLSRVVLKIDTASFVLDHHKKWRPFVFRESSNACLATQDCLSLSDIKGILTTPERGLVGKEISSLSLVPRSVVQLKKAEWVQWAQSEIKGHGRVFWKKQEHLELQGPPEDVFSTEQILARHFISVAVRPGHSDEALVSGKGVFWTRDGKSWIRLSHFQNEDLPVAINTRGDLFVGGFFSRDQGKSFQPFLKWEDLTTLLESRHRRTPGVLRLSEIKTPSPEQVEVQLDTGAGKMRLSGSNRYGLVTDWKILDFTN